MRYNISLLAGTIFLVIALFIFRRSLEFLKTSNRAMATVVALDRIESSDGASFRPVFTFRTALGQEITYRPSVSGSPPPWDVGETEVIAYMPDDPARARLLTYFGSFGWTVVLMAIGLPLIVIGAGYRLLRPHLRW